MSARHFIVRADGSMSIGTGHLIRSRTLADGLVRRGWRATLVTRGLPTGLVDGFARAGIDVLDLPGTSTVESEWGAIADHITGDRAVIAADHYGLDATWFDGLRRTAPTAVLMAIDDLANRPLPVDILLNQNLGVTSASYVDLVRLDTRVLTGPAYALLRPEFGRLRAAGRVRDGRVERILVFMSGADATDVTSRAIHGLAALGSSVDIVLGAAYPWLDRTRAFVARQRGATLHVNTDDMASLMDRADLAIGAASSASWERCALGLPAVLVTLADNQVDVERRLVESGAAISIGRDADVTPDDIGRAVGRLREDPTRVAAMSRAAALVTDGNGTSRVIAEIERRMPRERDPR